MDISSPSNINRLTLPIRALGSNLYNRILGQKRKHAENVFPLNVPNEVDQMTEKIGT